MNGLDMIAAILLTVYELEREARHKDSKLPIVIPASSVYIALGMDMYAFERMAATMRRAGVADIGPETISLTEKGRNLAIRVENALSGGAKDEQPKEDA